MPKLTSKTTVVKVEHGGPTVAKTMALDKYPIVLRVVDGVFSIFIHRKIHKSALCLAGVEINRKGWKLEQFRAFVVYEGCQKRYGRPVRLLHWIDAERSLLSRA